MVISRNGRQGRQGRIKRVAPDETEKRNNSFFMQVPEKRSWKKLGDVESLFAIVAFFA
jgi:hypothetical protein